MTRRIPATTETSRRRRIVNARRTRELAKTSTNQLTIARWIHRPADRTIDAGTMTGNAPGNRFSSASKAASGAHSSALSNSELAASIMRLSAPDVTLRAMFFRAAARVARTRCAR